MWQRTSLPTQLLHSATSFLMMAGMARFAPSQDFALAAAFFLLVTLASSLNIQVLSAAWLRLPAAAVSAAHPLAAFTWLSSGVVGSVLGLAWAAYRHWAFGPGGLAEWLLTVAGGIAYLGYLAWRRQWLLEARFATATWGDGLRALVLLLGALAAHEASPGLDFREFLGLFFLSHALAMLPALRGVGAGGAQAGRWWQRGLLPLHTLGRGDWLAVGSGLANVAFSQAASLLAPVLIGATQYATLRAYELFLFPTIFMAQVLDPIYMRRYRDASAQAAGAAPASMLWPALALFAPLALLCLAVATLPWACRGLELLIAPEYRAEIGLLGLVLALSAWVALNAPLRWRLTVAGHGAPLLRGTAVGIVASLATLLLLTASSPLAWTVLVARIVYEACLWVAGHRAVQALQRGLGQ
jgi:hypothetical protein